nr:MAG TPA: hypothetical protein [Caudoviricetes sp.]
MRPTPRRSRPRRRGAKKWHSSQPKGLPRGLCRDRLEAQDKQRA